MARILYQRFGQFELYREPMDNGLEAGLGELRLVVPATECTDNELLGGAIRRAMRSLRVSPRNLMDMGHRFRSVGWNIAGALLMKIAAMMLAEDEPTEQRGWW